MFTLKSGSSEMCRTNRWHECISHVCQPLAVTALSRDCSGPLYQVPSYRLGLQVCVIMVIQVKTILARCSIPITNTSTQQLQVANLKTMLLDHLGHTPPNTAKNGTTFTSNLDAIHKSNGTKACKITPYATHTPTTTPSLSPCHQVLFTVHHSLPLPFPPFPLPPLLALRHHTYNQKDTL